MKILAVIGMLAATLLVASSTAAGGIKICQKTAAGWVCVTK